MATYNDAAVEYDQEDLTYDGVALRSDVTLVVGAFDRTDELDDDGVSIRASSEGSSRGTLDATLDDPAAAPASGEAVAFYVGTLKLFGGELRDLDVTERLDHSLEVSIGASDQGPGSLGLPGAAPFAIVDQAPDSGEVEYSTLSRAVRRKDDGSTETSYELELEADGLLPGMNVDVTSSAFGLSATELAVVAMSAKRRYADQPEYVFTLGDPRVSLAQVVKEASDIPAGSITETEIADGAISTPKLAANVVVTQVANVAGTVVIDQSGIVVTGGAITVIGPDGTVIVDGSSNMFKIVATGTLSQTQADQTQGSASVDLTGLGTWTYVPAVLLFISEGGTTANRWHPSVWVPQWEVSFVGASLGGATLRRAVTTGQVGDGSSLLNGSSQVQVRLRLSNHGGASQTIYARYYVLKEAAF